MDLKEASKICYGTLALSPLQCEYSLERKAELLLYGYERGMNFFDTAELYDNYDIFSELLKKVDREDIIISTKSYAWSEETAEKSIEKALKEMDTAYIDIFMLHEQESIHTFRGHYDAVKRLLKYKEDGIIRHFGISTHFHSAVRDLADKDEIEIIHPIFNRKGLGIVDGTIDDMTESINLAKQNGKKILSMKPLGGGHLTEAPADALKFSFESPLVDWTAVGMRYEEEIDFNLAVLNNEDPEGFLEDSINNKKRKLKIAYWCTGCGNCVERCQQGALKITDGKCIVDSDKCVLCSYCASACDEFCIKIV
ncbi:Predicted oxidoreductase [Dethiosulfatibacter aminovorans DSM 17477]|uniref:Predicted oxidoreductase n=1 Tax=Dethiosulfatibacter aminovorans DSM 17477 TaxID=1121476 RepID=A0A1M6D648_9FIRM|nr:aldo/keto reductase [Dethiosulfatibacter aminovorans]SHI68686.1 Predicted oxidoreductase [Dethiosulfatibacter aminovorans DSM 17477]